jgi:hypothetical protein
MSLAQGHLRDANASSAWRMGFSAIVASGLILLLAACGGGGGSATGSAGGGSGVGSGGGGSGGGGGGGTGTAPAISMQPQPQTAITGSTATFSVSATGTAPLGYQWAKNGTAISGATDSSYTTPAVTLADGGATFTVTVSNSTGSVTSSSAKLSANADPEGIYKGTMTFALAGATLPIFAIVLKDGTAAAFVTDHVLPTNAPVGYSLHGLSVIASGGTFTSSFTALLQSGYVFNNGVITEKTSSGTLTGTVNPGTSITGTFTSDLDHGTFTLNAMTADYNRLASLASLAGTYKYDSAYFDTTTQTEKVFESTTTAGADGVGSATTTTGCTSTGSITTVPDPMHNAYTTTANFTCSVAPPTLTFTALSAFFPAGTGAGIVGSTAFTSDTTVIITDDVPDQISFMIISAKQ